MGLKYERIIYQYEKKNRKLFKFQRKKEYSNLDKIFELYLHGDIKKLLSKYSKVEIYPTINKLDKTSQLNYSKLGIWVAHGEGKFSLPYDEDKYNVVIYHAGISNEEFKKLFTNYDYQDNFNLEKLINEIDTQIKNHPRLKDTSSLKKKKKTYFIIALISFCIPIIFLVVMTLYCFITGKSVQGNVYWLIFLIVIPLIVWLIFDKKSKKIN